jgi:Cu+-exporting ATPase
MNDPAAERRTWFRVEGMTCQNCVRHAREAAESVTGAAAASVNLDTGRLRVRWTEGSVPDPESVMAAVRKAGFSASIIADPGNAAVPSAVPGAGWRFNVYFGGTVTLILMIAEWGLGWMHRPWYPLLAFALAAPVQVFCGGRFYRGAWNQLKQGASNMDTLVSLGSTAAFGFSAWIVFGGPRGGHVFFMESVSILTLISLGHWLEAKASAKASGAIETLMELAPQTARRIEVDRTEREVPASELMVGDRIAIRPGDRVATDAEVTEGASAVDEAMFSGESKPVEKTAGTKVFAGTRNLDGRLVARVTATGDATALAGIVAAVERAQNSRAGIQRLADRISSVFVPVVILLAGLTAYWWGVAPESARALHAWLGQYLWLIPIPDGVVAAAVVQATSVLIVACPCAMGLATPAAIMAGTNAAALRGILIRDGVALEKAGRIDTIVFDKTGTLTEGRLVVVAVEDCRPASERSIKVEGLAASLARHSNHPVSVTLAALAPAPRTPAASPSVPSLPTLPTLPPLSVPRPAIAGGAGAVGLRTDLRFVPKVAGLNDESWQDWRELRGRGIEARRGGAVYRLGSLSWLHECGVADVAEEKGGAVARGAAVTLVGLSIDDRLVALFELRDALRSEAHDLVADLHSDGFDVILLTGDAWLAAEAVAQESGIGSAKVLAEVKPEQKAESIARLQSKGHRVAFVGDGINDGPALAQADLGIAVSRASDVARESADVVLIRGGLASVREAIGISQATLRAIRQNLFWAFFYNAAAIPLAMLGFFNPIVCAAAMGVSDLVVIGNALRLRYWTLSAKRPRPARVRRHPSTSVPDLD